MTGATSSYSHMMGTGDSYEQENKLVAQRIDDRTATLPDGTRLRITPERQKTVNLLVQDGDIVRTTYETGGKVIDVLGPFITYGLHWYTIVYVDPEAKRFLNGNYSDNDIRWINECVAQDGRVRMLFEHNPDEVLIVKKAIRGALLLTILAEHRRKKTP